MSTQPNLTPQWKEEVNRRLAAHKSRKGLSTAQEAAQPTSLNSRAAEAASRVAARYAKAPSYTQMQAEEARVAVRAAEIATKVALEAQAVAESALAELHAASQEQPSRGPAVVQSIAQPVRTSEGESAPVPVPIARPQAEPAKSEPAQAISAPSAAPQLEPVVDRQSLAVLWDPDLPVRKIERTLPPVRRVAEEFEIPVEDWWSPAEVTENLRNNPIEVGEEPVHANLIQFPRELVATRKMRPRRAEANSVPITEAEGQLSIFEVDPDTVSTEVSVTALEEQPRGSIWSRTEWSGIRLDTQPAAAPAEAVSRERSLPVAPFGLRLMAVAVDGALILASFVMAGFLAARMFDQPPVGKAAELLGVGGLALIGLLYYALFFSLLVSTPGMKYAGIGLCTFDDQSPTRAQLRRRLGAMALSLLPVGLGLVWSMFDEDHLSWHDRFSQTYLRKL